LPVRRLRPNSPPSLAKDGTIYASTSEALYAVNPDGILKWEFPLPQNNKRSFSVVGNDGTIYLGTGAGIIYALSPDGKVKWEFNTRGIMWHPPAISSEGMIYAVSIQRTGKGYGSKGQVYAINNKDGSQEWMLETMDNQGRTPVIGNDDTIYVSEHYSKLYAISPKGVVKWEMEFGGGPDIAAGPDKNVYAFNSHERTLYKIQSDGTKELLFKTDGYIDLGLPSVGADKMILVSEKKFSALYSISPSGSLKLKYYLNSIRYGTFALDNNGTAYIGNGKIYGTLSAINPDGTKKWEFIKRD
jgi:outer membrane protein assembly factor BamB